MRPSPPALKTAKELFGPDSPPANTRQRITEVALNLFYAHGFHTIGLDRVILDAGITKTTFYNHFESKDDLIVAALKMRDQWEGASYARRVKELAGDDPLKTMTAAFDVLDEWFNHPDYTGCLFIKAAAIYPAAADPVHATVADTFRNMEGSFVASATAAGAADPQTLASKLMLLLEGALTRRMVSHDNRAAAVAREAAQSLIDEHMAG